MLVVTNLNKFVVIAFGIGESRTWQAVLARKNRRRTRRARRRSADAEAGKK